MTKAPKWNKIFADTCEFMLSIAKISDIPMVDLPEIAFAGRSNVGKSSLLNALVGRKSLAKTSATPGRTRQLNFFLLAQVLTLVDLPGYGYAKAAKKEIQGWNKLIEQYLKGRTQLRRVFLLIDSRHGIKANDSEIMEFLDKLAIPYQLILTKSDKISKESLAEVTESARKIMPSHPAIYPEIIMTSAKDKTGIKELRAEIVKFIKT